MLPSFFFFLPVFRPKPATSFCLIKDGDLGVTYLIRLTDVLLIYSMSLSFKLHLSHCSVRWRRVCFLAAIFCHYSSVLWNFSAHSLFLSSSPPLLPSPLRHPSLSGQQFRLSPRRQPSTLAQVTSGAHRDGRSRQFSSAHAPAPPQRPPGRPHPPPPQSCCRLGSVPPPTHSQPCQPVPLPAPGLLDSLQTPRTTFHRAATECRRGPPLKHRDYSRCPFIPPPLPLLDPIILYYPPTTTPFPKCNTHQSAEYKKKKLTE